MDLVFNSIISLVMSIILSLGSFFGMLFETAQTPVGHNEIKNVIYLIGDGMGFNHLDKTAAERSIALTMDTFPVQGSSMTRSLSDAVTDSAAGGTALATGVRTGNGMIGVYYDDSYMVKSYPKNIIELCQEKGMMTGVVTTDETSGATPASFSAHSFSRGNVADISADQLKSDIDLIWGKAVSAVTKADAEANGYTYISTYDEMTALAEGSRSFGQFVNSLWVLEPKAYTPNLSQMAVKAVDILDDTEEGFFLMIEGAHIDKHSHNNDSSEMTEALAEFDLTVKAMLDYAINDGETLVVVTADHETGAIICKDNEYVFTSDSHSGVDVPVLVYGSDTLIADGQTINNYEIPIRIARELGFSENEFPVSVSVE